MSKPLCRLCPSPAHFNFREGILLCAECAADILKLCEIDSTCGGVESKAGRPDRSPLEHASGTALEGGHVGATGKDALAGFARADKSAQPTAGNCRIPEKPETAYSTDRQIAGVAPGPQDFIISPVTQNQNQNPPQPLQVTEHDGIPQMFRRAG